MPLSKLGPCPTPIHYRALGLDASHIRLRGLEANPFGAALTEEKSDLSDVAEKWVFDVERIVLE